MPNTSRMGLWWIWRGSWQLQIIPSPCRTSMTNWKSHGRPNWMGSSSSWDLSWYLWPYGACVILVKRSDESDCCEMPCNNSMTVTTASGCITSSHPPNLSSSLNHDLPQTNHPRWTSCNHPPLPLTIPPMPIKTDSLIIRRVPHLLQLPILTLSSATATPNNFKNHYFPKTKKVRLFNYCWKYRWIELSFLLCNYLMNLFVKKRAKYWSLWSHRVVNGLCFAMDQYSRVITILFFSISISISISEHWVNGRQGILTGSCWHVKSTWKFLLLSGRHNMDVYELMWWMGIIALTSTMEDPSSGIFFASWSLLDQKDHVIILYRI